LELEAKRMAIEPGHPAISVRRQCDLLGLARSSLYYRPQGEDGINAYLMRLLDEQYTRTPFYGVAKMTEWLRREGHLVNLKRVRRLLRRMGLEAIYPRRKRGLSVPGEGVRTYPYLLRDVAVVRPDQVWAADITYLRLYRGWAYLVAILDWYSRYVVAWEMSVTLEAGFCVAALEAALGTGRRPEIVNTDQGSQFTSEAWTGLVESSGIAISMDGRGRVFDNIFVERLWRTVKYEDVYLKDYQTPAEARLGLGRYFGFYNHERPHQSLSYRTPAEVYGLAAVGKEAVGPVGGATAGVAAGPPVALRAPCGPAALSGAMSPPKTARILV
jgi:putative transposase